MSKNPQKSRYFAVVTYIRDTTEVLKIIASKRDSIRAYAVIKHDKDAGDIHHHVIIRTHSTWCSSAISKWFAKNAENANTFAENVIDRAGVVDYLTHKNQPEKHQYDDADIIDGGLSDIVPNVDAHDESFEILEKLISGVSPREIARLYGKDFIYHYRSYAALVDKIKWTDELEENERRAANAREYSERLRRSRESAAALHSTLSQLSQKFANNCAFDENES